MRMLCIWTIITDRVTAGRLEPVTVLRIFVQVHFIEAGRAGIQFLQGGAVAHLRHCTRDTPRLWLRVDLLDIDESEQRGQTPFKAGGCHANVASSVSTGVVPGEVWVRRMPVPAGGTPIEQGSPQVVDGVIDDVLRRLVSLSADGNGPSDHPSRLPVSPYPA